VEDIPAPKEKHIPNKAKTRKQKKAKRKSSATKAIHPDDLLKATKIIHEGLAKTLMKEVGDKAKKIKARNQVEKKKINDQFSCENPQMLELVFGQFLEMVAIHYDDIFRLIVDDLLSDEVRELNRIEMLKHN
jgi:hypothetical protein